MSIQLRPIPQVATVHHPSAPTMSTSETSDASTNVSNPRKRGYETEDEDDDQTPAKKQKKLTKDEQRQDDLLENALHVQKSLALLVEMLETFSLLDPVMKTHVRFLSLLCDSVEISKKPRRASALKVLDTPIEQLGDEILSKLDPRKF